MEQFADGGPMVKKLTSVKTARPNCRMYTSIMLSMVGAMMFGLDQGNFGNVITFQDFREHWCVGAGYGTEADCFGEAAEDNVKWQTGFILWGGTLITLGAAAGALLVAPTLCNKAGRRPCIAIGGGTCFAGCLIASYLSFQQVWIFYIGRVITGAGVGIACMALPMYNAEMSTPTIRGATGSMFQLNVAIGSLTATLITLFVKDWAFGMFLPGIAGAILMVMMPFLPESPRYIMTKKNSYDKGKAELEKIRKGNVKVEANEMWEEVQNEKDIVELSFLELFQEKKPELKLRKRVFIACMLVCCQQLTGVNAFLSYAGTIFSKAGMSNPIMVNTVFNGWMIIFCAIGLSVIDSRVGGRRCQLLVATSIMGPPLVVGATALAAGWSSYITVACVMIYGGGFQFAWGMVPWVYPAEIFSMAEKESALALCVFVNYMFNAFIVYFTPIWMAWSTPGTFYIFAGLNIYCGIFVFLFVKETKGVPLDFVPALFTRSGQASVPCDASSDDEEVDSDDSASGPG